MNKLKEVRTLFFEVAAYIDLLRSNSGRPDVKTLSAKSVEIIDKFRADLIQLKLFDSDESIDKLTYSVCALLDEQTLLCLTPEEREVWLTSPLQIKYYSDNNSGEKICDEIEQICFEKENNDDFLALGYAVVLKLGFRGAFSTNNNRYQNIVLGLKSSYPELYDNNHNYTSNTNQKFKVWRFVGIRKIIIFCFVVLLCLLYFYCIKHL